MTHIVEGKKWTYEDYLDLENDKRYEILEGKLLMMTPAPEFNHQLVSAKLGFFIIQKEPEIKCSINLCPSFIYRPEAFALASVYGRPIPFSIPVPYATKGTGSGV